VTLRLFIFVHTLKATPCFNEGMSDTETFSFRRSLTKLKHPVNPKTPTTSRLTHNLTLDNLSRMIIRMYGRTSLLIIFPCATKILLLASGGKPQEPNFRKVTLRV
jgi:hypothetical protein